MVTIDDGIVDLASRRQAVPIVPDPAVGGSLRYDHERLEGPRLSPAAIRLLATCVGDLAEAMGGTLTAAPQFEPVYIGDDRCSIALILTVRVADLNRHAAEDAALRVAATSMDPQGVVEAIAEACGDGSPVGWRRGDVNKEGT